MGAITIPNPLPAVLVAISQETIEEVDRLTIASHLVTVDSVERYATANALYREIQAFEKQVEAQRATLKRPIIDLGNAIQEAAKSALGPLADQRAKLGAKIKDYEIAENARREEARRIAEAEARRKEAEAIAAAEFNRLPDAPDFVAPAVKPVRADPTPPPLAGVVKTKVTYELIIDDASKIPREMNGVPLLVPDVKAIKALIEMGATIPGCQLKKIEGTMAKGARAS